MLIKFTRDYDHRIDPTTIIAFRQNDEVDLDDEAAELILAKGAAIPFGVDDEDFPEIEEGEDED